MRERLGTISLALCVFFLPLGYDLVFWMVQELTGSYGLTTFLFYVLSAVFFGFYIYLHKKNPISHTKDKVKEKKDQIKSKFKKKEL